MESGKSGSLQSSTGGDDEFDSRFGGGVESGSSSLSALLRQSASPSPSVTGFGGSFYGLQDLAAVPLLPLPQAAHHWSPALSPSSSSSHGMPASADQAAPAQPTLPAPPRGSRKRTRASRRAPTTVLTTDTANFRAMVQEFTGIPSPPYAGTPARSRFDHPFPSPSSLSTAPGAASFPPYLLRPFVQKFQPSNFSPLASPSTPSPAPSSIATAPPTADSASSTVAAAAPGDNYTYNLLASAPATSALVGLRDHGGDNVPFHIPTISPLGGSAAKYASYQLFDGAGHRLLPSAPSPRLHDPADFLSLTTHGILAYEGTHSHPRYPDHELRYNELSGLVRGCGDRRMTLCSTDAGAPHGKPLLNRSVECKSPSDLATTTTTTTAVATAAMRTQGVDSWICTSE